MAEPRARGGLARLLRVTLFGCRGFLCLPPSIAPLPHLSNFEACCAVGVRGAVGGRVAVLSLPAAVWMLMNVCTDNLWLISHCLPPLKIYSRSIDAAVQGLHPRPSGDERGYEKTSRSLARCIAAVLGLMPYPSVFSVSLLTKKTTSQVHPCSSRQTSFSSSRGLFLFHQPKLLLADRKGLNLSACLLSLLSLPLQPTLLTLAFSSSLSATKISC